MKILIRLSICDETKRVNRNFLLNFRMFKSHFIDLQNFILLVRTVPYFRKIIFISSYTEKDNYFLLYELIQDLPYLGSIGMDCVISEQCYKGTILQLCNRKMTIL